jgi:hypothetical protein
MPVLHHEGSQWRISQQRIQFNQTHRGKLSRRDPALTSIEYRVMSSDIRN